MPINSLPHVSCTLTHSECTDSLICVYMCVDARTHTQMEESLRKAKQVFAQPSGDDAAPLAHKLGNSDSLLAMPALRHATGSDQLLGASLNGFSDHALAMDKEDEEEAVGLSANELAALGDLNGAATAVRKHDLEARLSQITQVALELLMLPFLCASLSNRLRLCLRGSRCGRRCWHTKPTRMVLYAGLQRHRTMRRELRAAPGGPTRPCRPRRSRLFPCPPSLCTLFFFLPCPPSLCTLFFFLLARHCIESGGRMRVSDMRLTQTSVKQERNCGAGLRLDRQHCAAAEAQGGRQQPRQRGGHTLVCCQGTKRQWGRSKLRVPAVARAVAPGREQEQGCRRHLLELHTKA